MSQSGRLVTVTSTDGTDFAEAALQDVALLANLPIQTLTRGRDPGMLRSMRIMSSANRQWEVAFYASKDTRSADPNVDRFLGRFQFQAASGVQEASAGLFRYYVDSLNILLEDVDDTHQLHMELIARNGNKSSYGAGEHIRVAVDIEPLSTG